MAAVAEEWELISTDRLAADWPERQKPIKYIQKLLINKKEKIREKSRQMNNKYLAYDLHGGRIVGRFSKLSQQKAAARGCRVV